MNQLATARLGRLQTQLHGFLDECLRGVPVEVLSRPRVEGKWSALENLAHLARYQEVFLDRVEKIRREEKPGFAAYRAEKDPEWSTWQKLEYKEVLARMAASRDQLLARLESLSDDEYARVGVHPRFGEMPLALWIEFFLAHEGHHLYAVLQQVRSPK